MNLQVCGTGSKSRKRPALVAGSNANGKFRLTNANMITDSGKSLFMAAVLMLAVLTPGVSNAAKTHLTEVARISAPPAGKALVNIHRRLKDSLAGNSIRSPIFDGSGTFLMDLPGDCECQLVCEPGQKTFITWYGASSVCVVTAELAPDKKYDLVLCLDSKGVVLVPLSQAPAKLRKLDLDGPKQQQAEKVFTLQRDEAALSYEASQKAHIEQIKTDFLGGKKSGRVVYVN
jgi:hypothetical protein